VRHDLVAERQLLALALSGHPSIRERFLALPAGVWDESTDPVATVLRDRFVREIPVNALTVAADVESVAATTEQGKRLHQFVVDCEMTAPPLDSWGYYAEQVLLCFSIRQAWLQSQRLSQRLESAVEASQVAEIVRTAVEDLGAASEHLVERSTEPPLSLSDLLEEAEEPFNWLVPGLWERMDRVIVTGYEGTGKSFLLAQCALAVAAGIHPFAGVPFVKHGCRVLVLDCENSRRQIRRRYSKVRRNIDALRDVHGMPPLDWTSQVRLVMRPEGVDLANVQEFARLEQQIAASAPDLVVAGPLYRMSKLDVKDDQAAKELTDALDRLRVKYGFTLIAEAHVGHAGETTGGRKLRPFGSSLFLRWPEFGYGIRAFGDAQKEEHPSTVELVAWRGSRDERQWPALLHHNVDTLPWMPDQAYCDGVQFGAESIGLRRAA
jgi:hypothetical protein